MQVETLTPTMCYRLENARKRTVCFIELFLYFIPWSSLLPTSRACSYPLYPFAIPLAVGFLIILKLVRVLCRSNSFALIFSFSKLVTLQFPSFLHWSLRKASKSPASQRSTHGTFEQGSKAARLRRLRKLGFNLSICLFKFFFKQKKSQLFRSSASGLGQSSAARMPSTSTRTSCLTCNTGNTVLQRCAGQVIHWSTSYVSSQVSHSHTNVITLTWSKWFNMVDFSQCTWKRQISRSL